jgi:hypothetical protein
MKYNIGEVTQVLSFLCKTSLPNLVVSNIVTLVVHSCYLLATIYTLNIVSLSSLLSRVCLKVQDILL